MQYNGRLTDSVLGLISHAMNEGHNVELFFSLEPNEEPRYMHKVKLNNDCDYGRHGGGAKFIRGCFMADALVWGNDCDVFETYLEEYVSSEEPEDEEDAEYGTYDGCGGWYSEATIANIMFCPTDGYHWRLQITPSDEV